MRALTLYALGLSLLLLGAAATTAMADDGSGTTSAAAAADAAIEVPLLNQYDNSYTMESSAYTEDYVPLPDTLAAPAAAATSTTTSNAGEVETPAPEVLAAADPVSADATSADYYTDSASSSTDGYSYEGAYQEPSAAASTDASTDGAAPSKVQEGQNTAAEGDNSAVLVARPVDKVFKPVFMTLAAGATPQEKEQAQPEYYDSEVTMDGVLQDAMIEVPTVGSSGNSSDGDNKNVVLELESGRLPQPAATTTFIAPKLGDSSGSGSTSTSEEGSSSSSTLDGDIGNTDVDSVLQDAAERLQQPLDETHAVIDSSSGDEEEQLLPEDASAQAEAAASAADVDADLTTAAPADNEEEEQQVQQEEEGAQVAGDADMTTMPSSSSSDAAASMTTTATPTSGAGDLLSSSVAPATVAAGTSSGDAASGSSTPRPLDLRGQLGVAVGVIAFVALVAGGAYFFAKGKRIHDEPNPYRGTAVRESLGGGSDLEAGHDQRSREHYNPVFTLGGNGKDM